jgi:hypothetical protein
MSDVPDVPENMEAFPPVPRLGGAIGRTATVACQQDQHDLCQGQCWCRCHERSLSGEEQDEIGW